MFKVAQPPGGVSSLDYLFHDYGVDSRQKQVRFSSQQNLFESKNTNLNSNNNNNNILFGENNFARGRDNTNNQRNGYNPITGQSHFDEDRNRNLTYETHKAQQFTDPFASTLKQRTDIGSWYNKPTDLQRSSTKVQQPPGGMSNLRLF